MSFIQLISTAQAFGAPQTLSGGGLLLLSHTHQVHRGSEGSILKSYRFLRKQKGINVSVPVLLSSSCHAVESQAVRSSSSLPLAAVRGKKYQLQRDGCISLAQHLNSCGKPFKCIVASKKLLLSSLAPFLYHSLFTALSESRIFC